MNRLAQEKSPYLLQHAHNPVDWHPWGEEAFARARREDKPVFLSIGYSTCHWCHVMERESFADEEVARVLNSTFVCVKVDREERPDLDQHYMAVCQMLSGSGGWPLTIVVTPDKRPFFAGTYFPKSRRWGRPGLLDLVPVINEAWRTRRQQVLRSADEVMAALDRRRLRGKAGSRNILSATVFDEAFRELAADFDKARGGFGGAPKFPIPHPIGFLLRYWRRTGKGEALAMAGKTLRAMRRGGIFDHLGFGFHRYSTDADWLVPHFEKMLSDQALLAEVYAESFEATGKSEFRRTAAEIADYVLRDLASPEGGFFTAEDADSEGEEGKFYLWTRAEIEAVLGPEEAELAARVFNICREGNFAEPGKARDGRNILHRSLISAGPAPEDGIPPEELDVRIEKIRRKLLLARNNRARPFRDTKVLCDGNGLMIAALAGVYRITADNRYLRAAERAADFILDRMRGSDGRLLHMFAAGEARVPAFLDDYAFLLKGLVSLYEAAFDPSRLETALELAERTTDLFEDEKEGGFFSVAEPEVGARPKDVDDGAVPSGNSVMLLSLLRLARLTGRPALEDRAMKLAKALSKEISSQPRLSTEFLRGLDYALGPSFEVVVVGKWEAPDTRELLLALNKARFPNTIGLFKPTDRPEVAKALESLAPFVGKMSDADGRAAAHVCSGGACLRPVSSSAELLKTIGGSS